MAFAELDRMIAILRGLGGAEVAQAVARRAAPLLDEAVKRTASAGQDPEGHPWPARKDGGRALERAADHITTRAAGNLVRMTLTGPDVFHHFGATRGQVRRQIIPDAGAEIPASVVAVLTQAARDEIAARLEGP